MSIIAYIDSLTKKHSNLDKQIEKAFLSGSDVTTLKKEKLLLKDQINKLKTLGKNSNTTKVA